MRCWRTVCELAVLLSLDGQDVENALVQDDNVFSVYRHRPVQLHLRVGHIHVRDALPRLPEEHSTTGHQTGTSLSVFRSLFTEKLSLA